MYITSFTLEQVGPARGLVCPVKIEWVFGPKLPDVVEVYRGHPSNAEPVAQVVIDGDDDRTSTTVTLPAGAPVLVAVCPRLRDDEGTPQDMQPDAHGVPRDWVSFALLDTITTVASEGTGTVVPDPPKAAPTIREVVSLPAAVQVLSLSLPPLGPATPTVVKVGHRIRVRWHSLHEHDKFLVGWTTNDPTRPGNPRGDTVDEDGKSGTYVLHGTSPGVEYSFNVKGGSRGFLDWVFTYTDWSPPVAVVARPSLRGLREYLQASDIDPVGGVRRYLLADAGSVRSFMQLA